MKKNLSNIEDINQWFMDIIHYAIPRKNNGYKSLLILEFSVKENRTLLETIIFIKNDNAETFSDIFKYLNDKYKFNPKNLNKKFINKY